MSSNGKARRRIFTVETPLEYRTFLTRDRWRQIIRQKHPALAGREKDVRRCLEAPDFVRESNKEPDVHLYYAPCDEILICVVVAPANESERFVVTAYLTENVKKGKKIWPS